MFKCLSLLLICCVSNAYAQDTLYARKVISTLCSKSFKGRGYIGKGDKKAAAYIVSEFKKFKLQPVSNTYIQKFNINVNTIKQVEVTYNGRLLVPGVDYLVDAASPSFSFEGEVEFVSYDSLNSPYSYDIVGYKQHHVVLDTFTSSYAENAAINNKKYSADRSKSLIIRLSNSKLTWTSSPVQAKFCGITLKSEVFDRHAPAKFKIRVNSRYLQGYESQNIIGMVPGTDKEMKDSFVVFTAHYDHLGMMGKSAVFPGANDNASGIAMLLNLVKYYTEHPQKYSMVFIAFSGEETGLIGSHYFVTKPLIPLENIRFLINIDLMANGAEGMMAVNGLVYYKEFLMMKTINDARHYLPDLRVRGKAANSDHYYFSENNVHCFFFYLMGNYPYYHDINDTPDKVPLTNFTGAFNLMVDFVTALQH